MISDSEAAADLIRARVGDEPVELAFILGTGLGSIADAVEDAIDIAYADLPGFPRTSVSGHEGRLVIGRQEGLRVAYLLGRAHYYETGDSRAMSSPLETLALIGVHTLVLTNAAGSIRADLFPGSLALVTDHINFNGQNPLLGAGSDGGFISLTEAYDLRLRARLKRASALAGVTLHEGVYMWFSGPSFETPAEIRMARMLGADLVGMSTVPEVILARRLAMRCAAVSVVTNFGAGFNSGAPSHSETRDVAAGGAVSLRRLIKVFLKTKDTAGAA